MAKSRRVHEIAKELGVDSKAIIAKCNAEGITDLKTHMSPVKLGLEQTIREWFSEAQGTVTAVETTEKVDLSKARRPARRRARPLGARDDQGDSAGGEGEAQVATAELPVRPSPVRAASEEAAPAPDEGAELPLPSAEPAAAEAGQAAPPPPAVQRPMAPSRSATARPVQPGRAAPAAVPPSAAATPGRAEVKPAGIQNVPSRPRDVRPAGEHLTRPQPAVLRGPQVVRIEKAEALPAPRPRRPMGPSGPRPAPGGGGPREPAPGGAGISRSRGPVRGRGAGAPAPVEEAPGKAPPSKRRSLSTRRGRSAEALPVGPSKFSEQDLLELDSKLHHASGFIKQRRRSLTTKSGLGGLAPSAAVAGGTVAIAEPINIKSLSAVTGIKATDIIKYLFNKGVMATINSAIAAETAMEVALEYDIELEVREQQTAEQQVVAEFEKREAIDLRPRPPVVTVLGHVDHGKTSLLDAIRKADVAAHEAGGITQHVGAYRVTIQGTDGADKTVVFLDTPGHEAFTSMRARGASLTDLVVLVVAADDGVMPTTIESINHAKAAGVNIIVALNKIDKAEATEGNIRKIYGQLAEHGLNPVEWGGQTEVVKTSATKGTGITELPEILDYQAELLELKADYGGPARGTVIESEMQPGRGPVARVLVQQGQMKIGDFIVIGRAFGRVRDMTDEYGKQVAQAGPATPLELSGIDMIPDAGDKFYVTDTLQKAEEIAQHTRETERHRQLASQAKVTLENFSRQLAAGTAKELRVVLKADVQGSIDVLKKSLTELGNQEVGVKVIHAGVGGITESDVLLADASDAIIIGFHVVAPPAVRDIAEQRGVDIRLYRIIYEATDDVTKALEGLLEPEKREEEVGAAEVREVFRITKVGAVAGCLVTEGTLQRASKVRLVRDGVVVSDHRNIEGLRRVKQDVSEVRAGTECGIKLQGFDDLKPGDRIVAYNVITTPRKLK